MINFAGSLTQELEATARRLRASTVQVQIRQRGGGSGIVWRSDGLIVTNAHVVPRPEAVVRLADGRVLAATVMAKDVEHDLAIVRVDVRDLPPAKLRDSGTLRVGELVLAMGNPTHMVGALRIGIIHTVRRSGWVEADIEVPPGYSGGPLSDANGCVVGVNSMASEDGLGFAVPTNTVEAFLSEIEGGSSKSGGKR